MAQLRSYQAEGVTDVELRLTELCSLGVPVPWRRVLYVLPTGGGKSLVAAELACHWCGRCCCRGVEGATEHTWATDDQEAEKVLFICYKQEPRQALRQEVNRRLPEDLRQRVQVATVQELYNHRQSFPFHEYGLVIVDETHHISVHAKMYVQVLRRCIHADIVGMTATPFRGDTGLERFHQWFRVPQHVLLQLQPRHRQRAALINHEVYGPDITQLTRKGYLAPISWLISGDRDFIDLELKSQGVLATSAVIVRIVRKQAANRKAIMVFAKGLKHGRELQREFQAANWSVAIVTGSTPKTKRAKSIQDLRNGNLRVLINIAVFTEGFDAPGIDCVVLARQTTSRVMYLQMIGRGLRPSGEGIADCLVMDFACNVSRFGPPAWIRPSCDNQFLQSTLTRSVSGNKPQSREGKSVAEESLMDLSVLTNARFTVETVPGSAAGSSSDAPADVAANAATAALFYELDNCSGRIAFGEVPGKLAAWLEDVYEVWAVPQPAGDGVPWKALIHDGRRASPNTPVEVAEFLAGLSAADAARASTARPVLERRFRERRATVSMLPPLIQEGAVVIRRPKKFTDPNGEMIRFADLWQVTKPVSMDAKPSTKVSLRELRRRPGAEPKASSAPLGELLLFPAQLFRSPSPQEVEEVQDASTQRVTVKQPARRPTPEQWICNGHCGSNTRDDLVPVVGPLTKVTLTMMETALEAAHFPSCTSRPYVTPKGCTFVFAFTLGLISNYSHATNCVVSDQTKNRPNLVRMCTQWLRQTHPEFTYTTIQLNKNYPCKLHVDANNEGPSYIIAHGKFTGGELWVYDPENGTVEMEVGEELKGYDFKVGDKIKGHLVNISEKWYHFDGRVPHCTMPFEGIRYSMVYYTRQRWQGISKAARQRLVEAGINPPELTGEEHRRAVAARVASSYDDKLFRQELIAPRSSGYLAFTENPEVALLYSSQYAQELAFEEGTYHEKIMVLDTVAYLRDQPHDHGIIRLAVETTEELKRTEYPANHWMHKLQKWQSSKPLPPEHATEIMRRLRSMAICSAFGVWLVDPSTSSWSVPKHESVRGGGSIITLEDMFSLRPGWELPNVAAYRYYDKLIQYTSSLVDSSKLAADEREEGEPGINWNVQMAVPDNMALTCPVAAVAKDVIPDWAKSLMNRFERRKKLKLAFSWVPRPRVADQECGTSNIPFEKMLIRLTKWLRVKKKWPSQGSLKVKKSVVERRLAKWIDKQRGEHARGVLEKSRVDRLEKVPGWLWRVRSGRGGMVAGKAGPAAAASSSGAAASAASGSAASSSGGGGGAVRLKRRAWSRPMAGAAKRRGAATVAAREEAPRTSSAAASSSGGATPASASGRRRLRKRPASAPSFGRRWRAGALSHRPSLADLDVVLVEEVEEVEESPPRRPRIALDVASDSPSPEYLD